MAAAQAVSEFVYSEEKPFDGIIAHLTRECRGNVCERHVVDIAASSLYGPGHEPKYIAELGKPSAYLSDLLPDSWIYYDFKERRVTPKGYTLSNYVWGWPKSWVVEVSNDGGEGQWEVVDSRDDNGDFKNPGENYHYEISNPPAGSFRFVRLRQTGQNHFKNDYLAVSSFELFGTLSSE